MEREVVVGEREVLERDLNWVLTILGVAVFDGG